VKNDSTEAKALTESELDGLVVAEYPYPIAANYRRLLETSDWEARTRRCLEVFKFGIRTITLGILSQYLLRDLHQVRDAELDGRLCKHLKQASLGQWVDFFFLTLRAYRGKRELLFIPELYDLYWDSSQKPHQPQDGLRQPFDELAQIRNSLAHLRTVPVDPVGWQVLGSSTLGHLRTVLGRFSFLRDYDLIRLVARQGKEYEYERYTGYKISLHSSEFHMQEDLRIGWFYLTRQDQLVLALHPLFVLWAGEEEPELQAASERDAAVYERASLEVVEYVATVAGVLVGDRNTELRDQFRELVQDLRGRSISFAQMPLTWAGLRQTAGQLSVDHMGTVRDKYRPELYLQRDEIMAKLQEFLASDKGCFVLTGKSGVGKSNFVLSLVDEFAGQENVALLMYDAARLDAEDSLLQTISNDLSKYMREQGRAVPSILAQLEQRVQVTGKVLLVVLDAINEHSEAGKLLVRIDQMVSKARYPWLKVLVTSRPQAWLMLKRGIPLAEDRYYRERGADEYWIEMPEFTVTLEPFHRAELPTVYEKYRQAYELQTPYQALEAPIRELLRDPLVLRLVAEIYRGKAIPEQIQVSDIVEQYLEELLRTERLQPEDLTLLEQELMPLMLAEDDYGNKATASQIHSVHTRDGRPLWELILSDDLLGNGERVNDPFARLVDADILVGTGFELDYAITSKYERFYEFFGGRYLYDVGQTVPNQVAFYDRLAESMPNRLFLWGVLVQALTRELVGGNTARFEHLVSSSETNPLLHTVLVAALKAFGDRDLVLAHGVVRQLIGDLTPAPRNVLTALWRVRLPIRESAAEPPARQRIGVEAACQLGMTDLLEDLAADPAPGLRALAAQQVFYLWTVDRSAGLAIVNGLSERIVNRFGLPDLGVAESMLGIVGAMLGREHQDPEMLDVLLTTGRRALRRLLHLTAGEQDSWLVGRAHQSFTRFLYRVVVASILRFALRVMTGWGKRAYLSQVGMAHVFSLSPEQKDLLRTFVPMLDPAMPGYEDRVLDIVAIENWGDPMAQGIVEMPIMARGQADFGTTLRVVQEIAEFSLRPDPPLFWVGGPMWNLWQAAIRFRDPSPELREQIAQLLDLEKRFCMAIQKDPQAWLDRAKADRLVPTTGDTRIAGVVQYVGASWTLDDHVFPESVLQVVERAKREKDVDYLRLYIHHGLVILFEYNLAHAALRGAEPLMTYPDQTVEDQAEEDQTKEDQTVQDALVDFLVRVRSSEPHLVDDWLAQRDYPEDIVRRVQASPTSERLSHMVTNQLAPIIYDLFMLGPEPLREELQWIVGQCLELSTFDQWLATVIKELLNLLVGELVFRVPEDAPSRRLLQTGEDARR
jgi:hypothetical protein